MPAALDFSYARPSGAELAAAGAPHALAYTGSGKPRPTRAEIDGWLAAGCSFTFIQESYPNRAQEGYDAGVADAQYADSQADAVGYPLTAAIVYCASDGTRDNPGPGAVGAISEYGRGVAATSRRPVLAYGNRLAVDAFRSGAGAVCVGTWVPATWGANPGQDVLVQEPNIASPVPDTDWNTTYGDWPRWSNGDEVHLDKDDLVAISDVVGTKVAGKDLTGADITNLYLLGEIIEIKKKLEIPVAGANVALLPSDIEAIAAKVAPLLAADLAKRLTD